LDSLSGEWTVAVMAIEEVGGGGGVWLAADGIRGEEDEVVWWRRSYRSKKEDPVVLRIEVKVVQAAPQTHFGLPLRPHERSGLAA
jgi:hypothetical protein